MAINQQGPTPVDRIMRIHNELKGMAQEAKQDGDHYSFRVRNSMIKQSSKIVVKAHARQEREELAEMSKAEKALFAKFREEKDREKSARGDE